MAQEILQEIIVGILVGGVYALMAVGLTLIFGVLDIINIAQGVLVILGAYLSYSLSTKAHIDLFVGLLITFRVGRFFRPRQHTRNKPTQYVDAWQEAARRLKTPDRDE